jgi:hypothetical protein
MPREKQTLEEILGQLSVLESSWRDAFADAVIKKLYSIPTKETYTKEDILNVLNSDDVELKGSKADRFQVCLTATRLILDLSKDQFNQILQQNLDGHPVGVSTFEKHPEVFQGALERLGLPVALTEIANTPVSWPDILVERLKVGRGSAISGQSRGRGLENYVEEIVKDIFGENNYQARCRFNGAKGIATEKCDFAIPGAEDPYILIEVKGYGATGSKQTDIIGDISRIAAEKRDDTYLLLFTDGITWRARRKDLATLIELQNEGKITKIYTKLMKDAFINELKRWKEFHKL